ncbi:MAG: hypothetical protein JXA57_06430 [Armatimonadetes bacterium]|nr:hypothetical protein [Armatimonadota bacterium]
MKSLISHVGIRCVHPIAIALLVLITSTASADILFEEHFDDPSFSQWYIHGDGVSLFDGAARIECTYWWNDGLESQEAFVTPTGRDVVQVEGWFQMDASNPRSASIVWLQDGWDNPYNGYAIEFAKDQDFPGDNRVFFHYVLDDVVLTYESVDLFVPGEWLGWRFCLRSTGCEIWTNHGSGWTQVYDEPEGAFDLLAVNLHGSGDTYGGGGPNVSYWDDILVHTESWCPVSQSTWTFIKASYR